MRTAVSVLGMLCAATLLAGCAASTPRAQPVARSAQPSAAPAVATVTLAAGFVPDPYNIEITAGGAQDARNRSAGCTGYIAPAPDLTVFYTSDNANYLSDYLYVYAASKADTTLVVQTPSGAWLCNDDDEVLDTIDPWVTILNPQRGTYRIWVGTVARDTYPDATLYVSEIDVPG